MSAAGLSALLVVLVGAFLRPRPEARRPPPAAAVDDRAPRRHRDRRPTSAARPRWPLRRRFRPGGDTVRAEHVGAWCASLAGAVRSGSTLPHAVRSTPPPGPIAETVGAIVLALDRGAPLAEAVAVERPGPDLALALTVIRACAETGGSAAEPLDRAAVALRARAAERAERRTHSAQARLSASVMTWLPVAVLGVLLVASSSVRGVVVTPPGAASVVLGVALNLLGRRWMRRVIADGST